MNNDETPQAAGAVPAKQLSVVNPLPVLRPPGIVNRTLDRVIPRKSKFFGFLWILAILGIALLFSNMQGTATRFHGIAETQQQDISFQYPVEIVEIPVVEGQSVDTGTRLLQVRRYDLDIDLAVIDERISEIDARRAATRRASSTEMVNLAAERLVKLESINTLIQSLQTKYNLNQALAASISAGSNSGMNAPASPLLSRIKGLKSEKHQLAAFYQGRIDAIEKELSQNLGPAQAQIAELEKQRQELERQSEALSVNAPFKGSVGGIMFKPGEQVDAFSPVLSVHGPSTQHVKGYIHEAVFNNVRVGQIVWIESPGAVGDATLISGIVESLGSRIVEYPQRLKRSALVSAWGREAIIRVQQENSLLLGEKVVILLQRPEPIFDKLLACLEDYIPISRVRAWAGDSENFDGQLPRFIDVRIKGINPVQLEASGIKWNPSSQSYFMVSDEHSSIFELSPTGDIISQIELDAFGKIDDLESISHDGTNFYVAASLSHNRNNELKSRRRNLMRLRIVGQEVRAADSIDLYRLLEELQKNPRSDAELRRFLGQAITDRSLDIEAHAVIDNSLYLGFKAPLDAGGHSVIVKIEDVVGLFTGRATRAKIWLRLKLKHAISSASSRLSDMSFHKDALYLLSVSRRDTRNASHLWKFDLTSQLLTTLREFPGLRAEGLSIDSSGTGVTIVFDGGGELPSQFVHTRI